LEITKQYFYETDEHKYAPCKIHVVMATWGTLRKGKKKRNV